jgi:gamma-glutamylcyclotransferase
MLERCTSWPAKRWGSDSWYFAYGSNLDIDQKELRTGTIRHAEACCLPGYRFLFNKRGSNGQRFANIVPDRSADVWGVAYLCSPAAMREMDRFEGVAGGHYFRVPVRLLTRTGEPRDAVTYVAGAKYLCEEATPTEAYLQKILKGALHHGLPEEYIRFIEAAAPRSP